MAHPFLPRYQILEVLGQGGMGVVYRARDNHLNRDVALKILRKERAADPASRQRFLREARAAAALRHPNIVAIHEAEVIDDVPFIAMELLEGSTVKELIDRGPLPLEQALAIALEVAEALSAAHAAGILHRDLKPGNIMVTHTGQVKVLDFGVAKLLVPVEFQREDGALNPTTLITSEGVLLGTPAYMSPEQIEGRELDERSDIFSFGSVLHEMISGQRAFLSESEIGALWAILKDDPAPLREIVPDVPRELDFLVRLCLVKDREHRLQRMRDARVILEAIAPLPEPPASMSTTGQVAPLPPAPPPARKARRPGWLPAAALLTAALLLAVWWLRPAGERTAETRFDRVTFSEGLASDPALSPDGYLLAFSSDAAGDGGQDIWLKQVGGGEPVRLTSGPMDETEPTFSPDGTRIAFRSERDGGGIYEIPAFGGEPRLIVRGGRSPRYSPDGTLIAYWVGPDRFAERIDVAQGTLWTVGATGGTPQQVAPDFVAAVAPLWSPDGKWLLFAARRDAGAQCWAVERSSGRLVNTGLHEAAAGLGLERITPPMAWLGGDRVVFAASMGDERGLWSAPLDPATLRILSRPQRLTRGPGSQDLASTGGGRLAFASLTWNEDIWMAALEANEGRVTGSWQRITAGPAAEVNATISTDGTSLLYLSRRSQLADLEVRNLASGTVRRVTASGTAGPGVLCPPRNELYYTDGELRERFIFGGSLDGGRLHRVGHPRWLSRIYHCSPDGAYLAVRASPDEEAISFVNTQSGEQFLITGDPEFRLFQARFSFDGAWLAFLGRDRRNRGHLFVAPVSGSRQAPRNSWITVASGDKPRWSPDGRLLYFTSDADGFRCIWAQRLESATRQPIGDPFAVAHFHDSRRSLSNVSLADLEIDIAPGKLVAVQGEAQGDIWLMEPAR